MLLDSSGIHDTEVKAGGTMYPPSKYSSENAKDYCFKMNGLRAVKHTRDILFCKKTESTKIIADDFDKYRNYLEYLGDNHGVDFSDVKMFITHQASPIFPSLLQKLGIYNYVNVLNKYGNTVSSGVPLALIHALEVEHTIHTGDKVVLMGTAAGLAVNLMIYKI